MVLDSNSKVLVLDQNVSVNINLLVRRSECLKSSKLIDAIS